MGYQKKFEKEYDYILECMNSYGLEEATPEEKLQNFINRFADEYCCEWNKKQWPYIPTRIAEYLAGLPSSCSLDYDTYEITKIGIEWGYVNSSVDPDKQQQFYLEPSASKWNEKWWRHISSRIMEMVEYYGLSFPAQCYV